MAHIGSAYLQFVAAFAATLAYLTCGTLTGWPSPTIPRLQGNGSHIPLTPDEGSWIVASFSLTMLLPLLPVAFAVDVLGRKVVLAATALPFVASWLVVVFANSATDLVVSRVIASIGFGTVLTVGPMYMGEIAEDRIRGAIGTIFMSMMNAGTLLEYCVGPYLSFVNLAYVSLAVPVLFFAAFIWMPESPYFLLMRGRRDEAEASLLRLRGLKEPSAVKCELEAMDASLRLRASDGGGGGALKELFCRRGNRRSLLLCWGLMFFQMSSGVLAFLAYATDIFLRSGSSLDADVSAMVLGVVQLLGGVLASLLVDRAGRRPLLIVSCVGCAAALATEGCYFYLKDVAGADVSGLGWLPLTALIAFLVSYSLGLGPLPWAIVGEVFPPLVKGPASSLVTVSVALLSFGVTKLFQVLADDFGAHVAFWAFAGCCTLGIFFTLLAVPETKGKSLLQITASMDEEQFLFCCVRAKEMPKAPSSRKMIVAKTTSSSADCSCCHLLEDGTRLCCGQHEV